MCFAQPCPESLHAAAPQTWAPHIIRLLEEPEIGVLLGATALLLGVVSSSYHGAPDAGSWMLIAGAGAGGHGPTCWRLLVCASHDCRGAGGVQRAAACHTGRHALLVGLCR